MTNDEAAAKLYGAWSRRRQAEQARRDAERIEAPRGRVTAMERARRGEVTTLAEISRKDYSNPLDIVGKS